MTKNLIKLILKEAQNDLQQSQIWIETSLEVAVQREHSAKALIEILEVYYCGAIGGFDTVNGHGAATTAMFPRESVTVIV